MAFYALGAHRRLSFLTIYILIGASLIFYGYKGPANTVILAVSVLGNYAVAWMMNMTSESARKRILFWLGIIFNLGLLGYFKYMNFILENFALMTGGSFTFQNIALPLAISFYTFQQIAYLADTCQGIVKDRSFKNYILFVTFFPQLIIGPIVHHKEMMPQFAEKTFARFNWENFKIGYLYLFSGLLKKVLFSDYCAQIVDPVYGDAAAGVSVGFAEAWLATMAFSLQIYFDFSGYSDMALGIARMFGIRIPINFSSPYKSKNVTEFWRTWHMTFSRWLRDYLYVPLGGNKKGSARAAVNALIVFFLGGLWHGAAWTFVMWGLLQGLGITLSRVLESRRFYIPRAGAVAATFVFITLSWVLFRAQDMGTALSLYKVMFGVHGFDMYLREVFADNALFCAVGFVLVFFVPNTHVLIPKIGTLLEKLPRFSVAVLMIVFWGLTITLNLDSSAEFIYFDF